MRQLPPPHLAQDVGGPQQEPREVALVDGAVAHHLVPRHPRRPRLHQPREACVHPQRSLHGRPHCTGQPRESGPAGSGRRDSSASGGAMPALAAAPLQATSTASASEDRRGDSGLIPTRGLQVLQRLSRGLELREGFLHRQRGLVRAPHRAAVNGLARDESPKDRRELRGAQAGEGLGRDKELNAPSGGRGAGRGSGRARPVSQRGQGAEATEGCAGWAG